MTIRLAIIQLASVINGHSLHQRLTHRIREEGRGVVGMQFYKIFGGRGPRKSLVCCESILEFKVRYEFLINLTLFTHQVGGGGRW